MNDLERLEKYFDRVAAGFDAIYSGKKPLPSRVWDRLTRKSLHERLGYCLTTLAPLAGRTVLDVGCGSGRGSIALAEQGATVVGIDVSGRMLEMARELAQEKHLSDRCTFERDAGKRRTRDQARDLLRDRPSAMRFQTSNQRCGWPRASNGSSPPSILRSRRIM